MNAQWIVTGRGKGRTWTLVTPGRVDRVALARIYAGTQLCSYLVHDGEERLFNNTSKTLSEHKSAVKAALFARFKMLEALFGCGHEGALKLAMQVAGTSHISSDTRRETLDKLRAALQAQSR